MIEQIDQDMCYNGKVLDNTFRYVSGGCWFVKGSICKLEDEHSNFGTMGGLFRGPHICIAGNGEVEHCGHKVGEIRDDGEICSWEEFDIYDSEGILIQQCTEGEF